MSNKLSKKGDRKQNRTENLWPVLFHVNGKIKYSTVDLSKLCLGITVFKRGPVPSE